MIPVRTILLQPKHRRARAQRRPRQVIVLKESASSWYGRTVRTRPALLWPKFAWEEVPCATSTA
jgi:hypothetical protein